MYKINTNRRMCWIFLSHIRVFLNYHILTSSVSSQEMPLDVYLYLWLKITGLKNMFTYEITTNVLFNINFYAKLVFFHVIFAPQTFLVCHTTFENIRYQHDPMWLENLKNWMAYQNKLLRQKFNFWNRFNLYSLTWDYY